MKKLWNILILLSVLLAGCNKTDDLWDEVHDLQKRLTKLEIQVNNLNGNITALQELYKNGASIKEVEEKDGVYTLTLSNGKVLKVVQKMEKTIFPIVGINEDGNWTVRYGDEAPVDLGIKAAGENGKTPQFRINEDGYWEIRYADTDEWTNQLGPDGAPVKAEGESAQGSEQYFESVGKSTDGKTFDIELKDGNKLSVPIVSSFSCTFEETVTGIQKFNSEESKTFKVLLSGVDNIALLAVPAGWVAELSEPENNEVTLTVTAPKAIATTRATASTSKDISILANANKFSTILKLQVEVIPAASTIDYEVLYDTNKDLFIIGEGASAITINKVNYPNKEVLDGSAPDLSTKLTGLSGNTIFFLSGSTAFQTGASVISLNNKEVVFINKMSDEKPTLTIGNDIRIQDNSSLVFKNLTITATTTAQSLLTNTGTTAAAAPKGFYCEDCNIKNLTKKILFLNAATHKINTIYFKNNKVEIGADKQTFFSTYNNGVTSNKIENVTIDNNAWYSKTLIQGFIYNNSLAGAAPQNISFSNNTIVNMSSQWTAAGNAAYIVVDGTNNLTINNNIAYCEDISTAAIGSYGSSFYRTAQADQPVTISGNIVFGLLSTINWNSYVYSSNTKVVQETGKQSITRYEKMPFETMNTTDGIFIPISELADKGSNLK